MPHRELQRLQEVHRYLKLKISKESELQEIAEFAAQICGTPIALITLIDHDTQYVKFRVGTDLAETTRTDAFCSHVITQDEVLIVPNTGLDSRFSNNPLRKGKTDIQFYAGAPLKTQDGMNLGSLCVIDHQARQLTDVQVNMLTILAKQVIHILEFDLSLQILKDQYLETKKNEITLRSVFESSGSCHMLLDLDLNMLFFNKTVYDVMLDTYKKELVVGNSIMEIIDTDFRDEFLSNINRALAGESITRESSLRHEGKVYFWRFNYFPAYNSAHEIIGVSYNATDVTDIKTAEAQTIEHEQMLKAIAFMQAHEIRKPVSSILGLMNLIKLDPELAAKEEIMMMDLAVAELDASIKKIVSSASAS
ncbi:GAF domain-containing protein [Pedobacter duraquae]|uniref:PAS domain S-box-containing protein n=1 Tax=Pedobacter duraquae TaxID=425511 RepID=A0A4R6IDA4_9SPHI|nr:GAF domain-containing protein [Pedobacter duraquae]TDO20243.1 PAS domain S-box-containing protein [Pedobacter duraquae]